MGGKTIRKIRIGLVQKDMVLLNGLLSMYGCSAMQGQGAGRYQSRVRFNMHFSLFEPELPALFRLFQRMEPVGKGLLQQL